jgi:hypothetical protein
MTELNGMLDKIMQIQNPALAEEKLNGAVNGKWKAGLSRD